MFRYFFVATNSLVLISFFNVKVTEHVQRTKVARVALDNIFILVDGRTDLALGNEAFSVPHRL
jgi:hypothetical protein